MAVSKVRKKTKGKPRGSIKRIPKVYSIKYKYIMGIIIQSWIGLSYILT